MEMAKRYGNMGTPKRHHGKAMAYAAWRQGKKGTWNEAENEKTQQNHIAHSIAGACDVPIFHHPALFDKCALQPAQRCLPQGIHRVWQFRECYPEFALPSGVCQFLPFCRGWGGVAAACRNCLGACNPPPETAHGAAACAPGNAGACADGGDCAGMA